MQSEQIKLFCFEKLLKIPKFGHSIPWCLGEPEVELSDPESELKFGSWTLELPEEEAVP